MDYEIQYARIATTNKLADRFLNAQIKANADLSKVNMGQIFVLVEILTPWFPTAQIGQTIINTFSNAYYEGGSTSDLVNFEEALKKVNENLAQITQNGETEWIGNLNAILGVIIENKIHLAQAGKAEAYVFRDGKINHLTEGLAQINEPHPLKTFSNITSGELKLHDKLLIANPEIYNHITLESLRQTIALSEPEEAILQVAKQLKKKKNHTVNALLINLLTTEELAKIPVKDGQCTIFLDRPLESIWAGGQRIWQQLVFPILKSFGKSTQKASNKTLSFTKNYVNTLSDKRKKDGIVKKRDLFENEFLSENKPEENLLKDEEINYSPDLEVHYYNEKLKEQQKVDYSKYLEPFKNVFPKIFGFIIESWENKKRRPYFFVAIAVIILAVIGFSVTKKDKANSFNLNEAQNTLRQAEKSYDQAKQANLSNDTEKAKQQYALAISDAQKITNYPVVGENAKQVLNNSYTELDKLTATTRVSTASPIFEASGAKSIFVSGGQAYLVTSNEIFKGLLTGGKLQKVGSLPKNSEFQSGSIIGKNIYLYTSSQKVYRFSMETESVELADTTGSWETANSTASYIGNIYLLDGVVGQIYKHALSNDFFNEGEKYINSGNVDIKDGKSITIDGSVYVLRGNGEVIKLQKGKLQEFSISGTPSPNSKIEKPVKIYTDADSPSIYILDAGVKRILEFDKDGHFTHQYALSTDSEVHDFQVSYKAKKIWVLTSKGLYETSI